MIIFGNFLVLMELGVGGVLILGKINISLEREKNRAILTLGQLGIFSAN